MKRRCVLGCGRSTMAQRTDMDEEPEPLCTQCSDSYAAIPTSFLAPPCPNQIIEWAARRARRFERKRWWHLRPKGAHP